MTEGPPGEPEADHGAPVLPEPVRRRIAGYARSVMAELPTPQIPADLRFAARWRSGAIPRGFAGRLLDTLAVDEDFRARVGAVLADQDRLAGEVCSGRTDPAADPASVGALLYLVRPQGWEARLSEVIGALAVDEAPRDALAEAEREIAALRAKLGGLQRRRKQEAADAAAGAEAEKARIGAVAERARTELAAVREELQRTQRERDDYRRTCGELERDVRRLRGQVDEARQQATSRRSAQREARLAASARARVLLDVLQSAAAGLSEELAIPAGTPDPADLVEAAAPERPGLSKRLHNAAELAAALTLPRCHLIVDGYNVSKGMWPNSALSQQRERLIGALTSLASRTGAEVTVVFDGAEVGGVPAVGTRSVRVRFSPPGELADRVIVRLVAADAVGRPLVVASSDGALTSGARSAGASTVEREVLAAMLGAGR